MRKIPSRKEGRRLIEKALTEYPKTRKSKRLLIVCVWTLQDKTWKDRPDEFIAYEAINPETIRRTCQRLQEKGMYLPEPEVVESNYELHKQVRGGNFEAIGVDV
jgi:hypothetical protein